MKCHYVSTISCFCWLSGHVIKIHLFVYKMMSNPTIRNSENYNSSHVIRDRDSETPGSILAQLNSRCLSNNRSNEQCLDLLLTLVYNSWYEALDARTLQAFLLSVTPGMQLYSGGSRISQRGNPEVWAANLLLPPANEVAGR